MVACTFNEAKELIKKLVNEKDFPRDESALSQKLLWAFVELGEATDAYKKGKDWKLVSNKSQSLYQTELWAQNTIFRIRIYLNRFP